jgi:hypothetical protein
MAHQNGRGNVARSAECHLAIAEGVKSRLARLSGVVVHHLDEATLLEIAGAGKLRGERGTVVRHPTVKTIAPW